MKTVGALMSSIRPNSTLSSPLKHVTPHMLAVSMLRQVMDRANEWGAADAAVTSEARAKLPMVCEFYQLRIFLDLLKQRFGARLSGLVESSLVSVTDVQRNNSGTDWFSRWMTAISVARELGPVQECHDNPSIGVDCQVADQVLKLIDESNDEKQAVRLVLAESLTYARIWAERVFPELVSKIEFDPTSVAFVKIETAYKGLTNRWREHPGYYERSLQRMEGNPLFPESQRYPTDQDIISAKYKDDTEAAQLSLEVENLLSEVKSIIDQGNIMATVVLDLMQHRIEPLMVRSAEIGQLPEAQRQLSALRKLMEGMLNSIPIPSNDILAFKNNWRLRTNIYIAQEWRTDVTRDIQSRGDLLAFESIETMRETLDILQDSNASLAESHRKLSLLTLELAKSEGFYIPGAAEKLHLLTGVSELEPKSNGSQERAWWKLW